MKQPVNRHLRRRFSAAFSAISRRSCDTPGPAPVVDGRRAGPSAGLAVAATARTKKERD